MKYKKLIGIYGTGVDGRRLHRILRNKIKGEIVCFFNTDIKLNNTKFFKIPVYEPSFNPKVLDKIDEIYLGGRYMDDQEKYLNKLRFKGKIIRTNRWKYKYSNKDILIREKILLKMLKKLIVIFDKNKINYVIDASSLLAMHRNQKLAEFTDVDIAINNDEDKIKKLLKVINKKNTFLKKKFIFHKKKHFLFKKGSFMQCVLTSKCDTFDREPVNIEFYSENKINNEYCRFVPPNLVSRIPEVFRNKVKNKIYRSLKLKIPAYTGKYLEHMYGKNWKKKDQNWKNEDSKKRFILFSKLKKK